MLAGAFGSLLGSLISYFAGAFLGRALIIKYGKFLLLDEKHLAATEQWFARHGSKAIFIGRLLPVVRHLISMPAGFARMNLVKFSAFTFAGALLWCSILAYAGVMLKQNWQLILSYTWIIDIFVAAAILIGAVFFYMRYIRK